jgi:hypothetical protein
MGGHRGHSPRGGAATAGMSVAPSPFGLRGKQEGGDGVSPGKVGKGGGSPCDSVMARVAGNGGTASVLARRCFSDGPHERRRGPAA